LTGAELPVPLARLLFSIHLSDGLAAGADSKTRRWN
jgi:hypothetical protein